MSRSIGRMPDYVAGSGFRIAPVLGVVRPGFTLDAQPDEVDAAFEVPLRFLMDPATIGATAACGATRSGSSTTCPMADRRIWGVTAGIIRTLYERLYA